MKVEKETEFTNESVLTLWDAFEGYYDIYRIEVETGISELWKINDGKAYSITRLEKDYFTNGIVLVVCVFAGENIRSWSRYIIQVCELNDWKIRMHTRNETIVKLMKKNYGFNSPQFILTREAQNGRFK